MRFNSRYGHRAVLCRYAGIPDQPVPVIIPHGIYGRAGICGAERDVPDLPVLSYPAYRDVDYERAGYTVIPCASPFVYALLMHPVPEATKGTLYFVAHSTPGVEARFDLQALLDDIEELPGPLTLCLHPHDMDTLASPLRARGYEVVSAGEYKTQGFLDNLIDLIGSNRHVASNAYGTHIVYALACGRPATIVGQPVEHFSRAKGIKIPEPQTDYMGPIREACREWHEEITDQQRAIARDYLRADAVLSPEAMRSVLTGGTL